MTSKVDDDEFDADKSDEDKFKDEFGEQSGGDELEDKFDDDEESEESDDEDKDRDRRVAESLATGWAGVAESLAAGSGVAATANDDASSSYSTLASPDSRSTSAAISLNRLDRSDISGYDLDSDLLAVSVLGCDVAKAEEESAFVISGKVKRVFESGSQARPGIINGVRAGGTALNTDFFHLVCSDHDGVDVLEARASVEIRLSGLAARWVALDLSSNDAAVAEVVVESFYADVLRLREPKRGYRHPSHG
ncbi:hypothetical protein QAD02_005138 [Eretmocerus hayati]|uniref:Uncharacterized protein n=1 Tax=Eretmocerus hayati TaxID=131215 RepID=A0ACC2NSM6_9HYME|nr:hypothetical protein QAD02_005138 [Eretmocerus hayati]